MCLNVRRFVTIVIMWFYFHVRVWILDGMVRSSFSALNDEV